VIIAKYYCARYSDHIPVYSVRALAHTGKTGARSDFGAGCNVN